MIVVFGATGPVGRGVVAELATRGKSFRAVSRDPEAARRVLPDRTEIVRADLRDPASVRAAVAGAESVLVLSPHDPDQHDLQAGLIDAARQAGAQRIVKLSGLNAAVSPHSHSTIGRLHWRTDQHLRHSGVPWAVVRPTPFMQNALDWLNTAVRFGRLRLPMGHARIAMVDAGDVSAVLVAALTGDAAAGQTYQVTGPRPLALSEVAQMLGRATGRSLSYRPIPARVAATVQRLRGEEPWLVQHQVALAELLASGAAEETTATVQQVTGRAPRDFADFVAATLEPSGVRRDDRAVGRSRTPRAG